MGFSAGKSRLVVLVLLAAGPSARAADRAVSARWLGQDRHDYCGHRESIKPNGYQDVHIAISGLSPRREIVAAWVTGYGGGEWQYRGVQNHHGVVIQRKPGATSADLFLEPYQVETGREINLRLKFDDGTETTSTFRGGRANPDFRMPDAALAAKWAGQERRDQAGIGPGVGPDGLQDAKIVLTKLPTTEKIASVLLEGPGGARWAFGPNPQGHNNAELVVNDKVPTEAALFFQPDRDLSGQTLTVTVTFSNDKKDSATLLAGRTDPKLAMPAAALPKIGALTFKSRWIGQDGSAVTGPGEVHVSLSGLPARAVVAAVLSDSVRGVWVHQDGNRLPLDVEEGSAALGFKVGRDRTTADLYFAPPRNESKATLTLRLVFADGTSAFGSFPGGECDPSLRAPALDPSEIVARPGDDLAALVARYGTVRLAKGNYPLSRPLVLKRPVAIIGEPGATLTFSQPLAEAPWTTALKIHAGKTTLKDFAIRFTGKVRWRTDVGWGPAVIGTTDNLDGIPITPKFKLTFSGLDIEGPGSSGSVPWEEAPRLLRLRDATAGSVVKNHLRGGLVHLFDGPWLVADNVYTGTPPATYSHAVFAVHDPHDVTIRNNRARPVGPSGKTWRFLLFVQRGDHDVVENNVIEGIGPRGDDTIPSMNAPEIILTESYHLRFEGRPAAVSTDGRLLKIDRVANTRAQTGDVVSVLSGTGAGQWRRIVQRIEPTVYLLDAPLPKGAQAVSISPGFVNEVFSTNTIDAKDGRAAAGFVLGGNHFGTQIRNNRIVGAGDAFQIMASASESPNIWGWSHAPILGMVFDGNTIEDSERGGVFGISHGGLCKSNRGRVYMTLALRGNTVTWSDGFLSRLARTGAKPSPVGITLGYVPSLDPGELVVDEKENRLVAPARASTSAVLKVNSALLDGRPTTNKSLPMTGLRAAAPRR